MRRWTRGVRAAILLVPVGLAACGRGDGAAPPIPGPPASRTEAGAAYDIGKLLVPGSVTIVKFMADW